MTDRGLHAQVMRGFLSQLKPKERTRIDAVLTGQNTL